jgi:hypothetical protein
MIFDTGSRTIAFLALPSLWSCGHIILIRKYTVQLAGCGNAATFIIQGV